MDKGRQLWAIVADAANHRTPAELRARIAALEGQLAEKRTIADAIAFVQKRLNDYVQEVGATDPETGTVEFPDGGEYAGEMEEIIDGLSALEATPPAPKVTEVRPIDDWHEDYGYAVWWTWEDGEWLGEPSYIGSPLCDDWPGYHTHWSPHPPFPSALTASQEPGR